MRLKAGFTLLELLVAMSVAVLLTMVAVPGFAAIVRSMNLTSAANTVVADLQLARSEAIKRGHRVSMCKSIDGVNCAPAGGWEQGWIVFEDDNNNGTRESEETILHQQDSFAAALRLAGNQNVSKYVSFVPTGSTLLANGGFQAGTLTLCSYSTHTTSARQIVINAAGRARVQKTSVPKCG